MEIRPFRALRYDAGVVGDVGSCIAPPYDVISPAEQEQLYEKNEHNIVRIIKGKAAASDSDDDNQYTRAADYLNTWIETGALKQDDNEAIYAYVQDFELAGNSVRRLSFVALAKLEQFGEAVKPHEQILTGPMLDRLNLRRATEAMFGLPFCVYEDKAGIADKIIDKSTSQTPLVDFCDKQNVRHRLFAITDQADVDAIVEMMRLKSCTIADGHHRYTMALNYAKESSNPAAYYPMLALANICHEGLVVLATHRVVGNLANFSRDKLLSELKGDFEVTEYPFDGPDTKTDARQKMLARMKAEYDANNNAFGLYAGGAFYVAVLRNRQAMDKVASQMSRPWRSLDVSVLHKLILEKCLGIGEKQLAEGGNVEYVKDTPNAIDELIAGIDAGRKQAAFFTNPPKLEQMQMVAEAGERMPQKSTFFYPKIYTGLTINKM
jgi:uncharacterized protein (DUF1015 family)